jgi:hypothetical protein
MTLPPTEFIEVKVLSLDFDKLNRNDKRKPTPWKIESCLIKCGMTGGIVFFVSDGLILRLAPQNDSGNVH